MAKRAMSQAGHQGPADHPEFLTRAEVAEVARCCCKTVARAEQRGFLRAVRRPGARVVLYDQTEVRRWLSGEVSQ